MEHNLGDALNLEGAISNMDFDQSDVVVSEGDITLESEVHDIPMEFENIEEEQIMMDTGSEEVIVSEFMGEQLSLQDYCIKHEEQQLVPIETETIQPNVITTHIETLPEFQYEPENIRIIKQEPVQQPKLIPIKAGATLIKNIAPKQVMIAPKPSKLPTGGSQKSVLTKQYAIAPKPAPRPVQLVKSSVMKVSLANLMQGNSKPIIAHLDGKLMMLPSRSTQKIKLLPASGTPVYIKTNDPQSQLISAKLTQPSKQIKPVLTKVAQGQSSVEASNQPAVITKLVPVSSAAGSVQARYVMQPKTVPIGGNKVLLSPTKSNVKFAKKQQLIAVKSSPSKLLPAPAQSTAKKVVISASSSQNMILKAAPTNTVMSKDGSLLLTPGQRTQLHQINVPGKGVQYIRLVTNSAATAKPKPAAQSNTIMVTDSKGNLIPLTEKVSATQPPVLVINSSNSNKNIQKTPKKLVRIAPVTSKVSQIVQKPRSSQSLLVPLSAPEVSQTEESKHSDEKSVDLQNLQVGDFYIEQAESSQESRSLLAQNTEMHKLDDAHNISEVVVDYETSEMQSPEDMNSTEGNCKAEEQEAPLIVIPSNYKQIKEDVSKEKTLVFMDDSQDMPSLEKPESTGPGLNIEAEIVPYLSPSSPPLLSDNEASRAGELGRPRKACNCAKSQCLKLYCDCFANGEFCNKCNCDNCHNNLENEELRQKAIRACLERNPNAFRPKIGKAKFGGPEPIRRHTKGCNCKRSGCLKNYCECFEAKIECTATCKCVGCRNVEDTAGKRRPPPDESRFDSMYRPPLNNNCRLPCSFVTVGVIEAVCQCLIAAASEGERAQGAAVDPESVDPVKGVIEEFSRCLQDIISASHQAPPILAEE